MKTCTICNIEKELESFYKDKKCKWWYKCSCKKCNIEDISNRFKTKKWLLRRIFNTQKNSSKQGWHPLPIYTKQELEEWFWKQSNAEELYSNRKQSWYLKDLKPSIDRLDDYKWYSLDNIQLMTWRENNNKWYKDRKNWINNKNSKSVIWINILTKEYKEFHSTKEAERQTWVHNSNIWQCCMWKIKKAWGYIWKYIN